MPTYKAEENRTRLLARLVRELLAERVDFEDVGDLVEGLKRRCARHRIGWTNDDITGALRLVASNTPLPGAAAVEAQRRRMAGRRPEPPQIGRAEAAAILARLGIRL